MENTYKTDISGKWVYLQYHEEAVKEAYEQGRKDAFKEAFDATLLSKLTSCAG
jgi:hypothetical protein